MSAHTPAPWSASEEFNVGRYPLTNVRSIAAGGAVLAHVNCRLGEPEANARLMAAAPDMLAALQRIAAADPSHSQFAVLAISEARDAIAKAMQV